MALWNVSKLDKHGCLVAIIIFGIDLNALIIIKICEDVRFTNTKMLRLCYTIEITCSLVTITATWPSSIISAHSWLCQSQCDKSLSSRFFKLN